MSLKGEIELDWSQRRLITRRTHLLRKKKTSKALKGGSLSILEKERRFKRTLLIFIKQQKKTPSEGERARFHLSGEEEIGNQ